MVTWRISGLLVLIAVMATSCIDVTLPQDVSLIPEDTSFIFMGQALSNIGGCPVWASDNGVIFVLMQDSRVENSDFDQITTPGTRSRLQLEVRNDLEGVGLPCIPDAIVAQVTSVREIVAQ